MKVDVVVGTLIRVIQCATYSFCNYGGEFMVNGKTMSPVMVHEVAALIRKIDPHAYVAIIEHRG